MKRIRMAIPASMIVLLVALAGCGAGTGKSSASPGEKLYQQAKGMAAKAYYTKAVELYKQARPLLEKEGKEKEADACRLGIQNVELYLMMYPYTLSLLKEEMKKAYPGLSDAQMDAVIKRNDLERKTIDGSTHYFGEAVKNIAFRDPEIAAKYPPYNDKQLQGLNWIMASIPEPSQVNPWQPYANPATYAGSGALNVPRDMLPQTGTLKLWFPLPDTTGPQPSVAVDRIEPTTYLKDPVMTSGDIGVAYMEVPLDQLKTDLNITLDFHFTHSEQHYAVDPGNVGAYDKSDAIYKEYTRSYGNIRITDEIRKTARKAAGGEKNPYLAAKKVYDYVVSHVKYSLMPHVLLWPRGLPESMYVQKNRYGDCGAQSMWYCALLRSLGIPARATGGFELFAGGFSGHFWAEFYVPNYGWIPVDTSVAQIADYIREWSPERKKRFKDYMFANQDNYRCVVQTDVDVPLIPPATETVLMPTTLQVPEALCDTMDDVPAAIIAGYWQLNLTGRTPPFPP